jgi:hypothetical protein
MKNHFKSISLLLLGALLAIVSLRIFQSFQNPPIITGYRDLEMRVDIAGNEMMIWKTVIPPVQKQSPGIAMHRHEYARILLPLTEGILQRRDADGSVTDYILEIGKPLLLPEDTEEGFHTDENLGKTPIEVIVLQFTQTPVKAEKLTAEDLSSVMVAQ